MKTIYKYPISLYASEAEVTLRGKIIHVGVQDSSPNSVCVWAEFDGEVEPVQAKLFVVGTGHPIEPENAEYVGSTVDNPFVWHVYRVV